MRLTFLLFLSLLIFNSCKNKDDDEVQKEGNCLTAEVDGANFTAETTTAAFVTTTIEWPNLGEQETRILTISGTIPNISGGDTRIISLTFGCTEFISDLDYVDSDEGCDVGMSYQVTNFLDPNATIFVNALSGSINIEEVSSDHIRGTFSFEGEDQDGTRYSVTNGFFDTDIIQ